MLGGIILTMFLEKAKRKSETTMDKHNWSLTTYVKTFVSVRTIGPPFALDMSARRIVRRHYKNSVQRVRIGRNISKIHGESITHCGAGCRPSPFSDVYSEKLLHSALSECKVPVHPSVDVHGRLSRLQHPSHYPGPCQGMDQGCG